MFQRPGCGGAGGGKRRGTSWVLHDAVDTARRAKKQVDDSALWIVRGQASCCMIAVLKAASARAPASPNPRAAYSATNRVYTSPTRSHPHLRKHRQITNTCLPPSSRCLLPCLLAHLLVAPRRSLPATQHNVAAAPCCRACFFPSNGAQNTHPPQPSPSARQSAWFHNPFRPPRRCCWVSTTAQQTRRHGEGRSEAQLLR